MRVMDARERARVPRLRKRTREWNVRVTESIRKIAGQRQRRRRNSSVAGLHWLVFQVAFGLLLAFYNREKPKQSVDVPLL